MEARVAVAGGVAAGALKGESAWERVVRVMARVVGSVAGLGVIGVALWVTVLAMAYRGQLNRQTGIVVPAIGMVAIGVGALLLFCSAVTGLRRGHRTGAAATLSVTMALLGVMVTFEAAERLSDWNFQPERGSVEAYWLAVGMTLLLGLAAVLQVRVMMGEWGGEPRGQEWSARHWGGMAGAALAGGGMVLSVGVPWVFHVWLMGQGRGDGYGGRSLTMSYVVPTQHVLRGMVGVGLLVCARRWRRGGWTPVVAGMGVSILFLTWVGMRTLRSYLIWGSWQGLGIGVWRFMPSESGTLGMGRLLLPLNIDVMATWVVTAGAVAMVVAGMREMRRRPGAYAMRGERMAGVVLSVAAGMLWLVVGAVLGVYGYWVMMDPWAGVAWTGQLLVFGLAGLAAASGVVYLMGRWQIGRRGWMPVAIMTLAMVQAGMIAVHLGWEVWRVIDAGLSGRRAEGPSLRQSPVLLVEGQAEVLLVVLAWLMWKMMGMQERGGPRFEVMVGEKGG